MILRARKMYSPNQQTGWHKWFAWYPVPIEDAEFPDIPRRAWLQFVERNGTFKVSFPTPWFEYEYRLLK